MKTVPHRIISKSPMWRLLLPGLMARGRVRARARAS